MAKQVLQAKFGVPIRIWTDQVEEQAMQQLHDLSTLPFIHHKGIAVMPDVHAGIGSTIGSVIPTRKAIIPAAVGVDIGCGMIAAKTSLNASHLPDSLTALRNSIEARIPLGAGGASKMTPDEKDVIWGKVPTLTGRMGDILDDADGKLEKVIGQFGSLGSGNHFIEICLDQDQQVWIMLHSGSRGIGNQIGRHFIELAKWEMERWFVTLPDKDLAYLPEGSEHFNDYLHAVQWAQDYAAGNRDLMLERVIEAMREHLPLFAVEKKAINCHHNYVELENHFGHNVYVTRKGAIRARGSDLGVIPGSMGTRSYIVRGKGNPESYCSCSHGAGRTMSRAAARKRFSLDDLKVQTAGVECRKDDAILDEIPGAYKDIDEVMENQKDLVEVIATLKAVLCVKGA